jgi:hypothetical protein
VPPALAVVGQRLYEGFHEQTHRKPGFPMRQPPFFQNSRFFINDIAKDARLSRLRCGWGSALPVPEARIQVGSRFVARGRAILK